MTAAPMPPSQMTPAAEQVLQLRDIHLPAPPPWWPPAPGWWLAGALALLLAAWAIGALIRRARARRRRRRIDALLDTLERQLIQAPSPLALAKLSELLKRLALQRHPAAEVAALSGDAWLAFLDRSGGGGVFAAGPGRILADGGYMRDLTGDFGAYPGTDLDVPALMAAVRQWVRHQEKGAS